MALWINFIFFSIQVSKYLKLNMRKGKKFLKSVIFIYFLSFQYKKNIYIFYLLLIDYFSSHFQYNTSILSLRVVWHMFFYEISSTLLRFYLTTNIQCTQKKLQILSYVTNVMYNNQIPAQIKTVLYTIFWHPILGL